MWRRNDFEKYWNKKLAAKQTNKQTNEIATTKRRMTENKNMNKSSRYFYVLWIRIQIFSEYIICVLYFCVLLLTWLYMCILYICHNHRFIFVFQLRQEWHKKNLSYKRCVILPYLNVGFRSTENSEKLQLIQFMNDIKMKNANNFTFVAM